MPSATRGTKRDSSNGSPHSAHAGDPLALTGPFDDGNANCDNHAGAAEEPRMGASEDSDKFQTTGAVLETKMKAMYEALEKAMTSAMAQMQAMQGRENPSPLSHQHQIRSGAPVSQSPGLSTAQTLPR